MEMESIYENRFSPKEEGRKMTIFGEFAYRQGWNGFAIHAHCIDEFISDLNGWIKTEQNQNNQLSIF